MQLSVKYLLLFLLFIGLESGISHAQNVSVQDSLPETPSSHTEAEQGEQESYLWYYIGGVIVVGLIIMYFESQKSNKH